MISRAETPPVVSVRSTGRALKVDDISAVRQQSRSPTARCACDETALGPWRMTAWVQGVPGRVPT
jgi:hypothetical protein